MQATLIRRREFLQTFGVAAGAALCRSAFAQQSDAGFDELLTAIPGAMEREGVPGLQIAVIRDGEIALFKSFGVVNAETRDAVSNETVFEAASLSKPVFAYLVMKLAEDGVIDLDAPLYTIEKPPADGPVELVEAITAKMILSHTTGFPNWHISSKPLTLGRS
ncbi:MAG: serine hydrolase [Candidatus Hydrogenedentes bacterium]|nr:serine hydrolase [Candidatus Hydrogenedentota bacterium]